jgi:hypothetical protein
LRLSWRTAICPCISSMICICGTEI